MAAFCCFRFRQKKKQERERMFAEPESPDSETIRFYTTTGKTLQMPSSTRTSRSPSGGFSGLRGLELGDVFASFGGKTRSSSTSPPSTLPPGGPSMTESRISAPIHLIHPVHSSPIPESPEDHEHDKPLSSDPEKSSLTPPPESLHPAFHVLPGTISRPAYRPGLGFTINELDGREIGRRSGSIRERSEGMSMSGSEGIVSPMSTPNTNERVSSNGFSAMSTPPFNLIAPASSMNFPQGHGHGQGQGNFHSNTAPNNLPPNGPAPTQSQSNAQSYHRRNNSSANNSSSSSLNPHTINQPQAQTQYVPQLAQGCRMNATIVENPYQMYRDSREHQQNMGYQNALERAQVQDRARSHGQGLGQGQVQSRGQRHMPMQKGKERERVSEGTEQNRQENEEGSGLKREISTHSIPIGLSLDAQPSASPPSPQNRNREMNPHDQNAQLQVHATLYGNNGDLPGPLQRRTQTQLSHIHTHTHAHTGSRSRSRSGPDPGSVSRMGNSHSPSNPMGSMSSTEQWNHRIPVTGSGSGVGGGNQQPGFTPPGFDFECRVVAPTPPP